MKINKNVILTIDGIWNSIVVFLFIGFTVRIFATGTGDGPGLLAFFYIRNGLIISIGNLFFQFLFLKYKLQYNVGLVTILIKCISLFICLAILLAISVQIVPTISE